MVSGCPVGEMQVGSLRTVAPQLGGSHPMVARYRCPFIVCLLCGRFQWPMGLPACVGREIQMECHAGAIFQQASRLNCFLRPALEIILTLLQAQPATVTLNRMDFGDVPERHAIGYSSHKNEYRYAAVHWIQVGNRLPRHAPASPPAHATCRNDNFRPRCRKGVCQGNYAEELLSADYRGRPGFLLDKAGAFAGTSTSRAAFTPQGTQAHTCLAFVAMLVGRPAPEAST